MAASCWSSLDSRVAVSVPRSARNQWRTSWKVMEEVRRRFKITDTTFHHHLPQRPPRIPGRSRNGDRHPRGQAAPAACGHEEGGPLRDLPASESIVYMFSSPVVSSRPSRHGDAATVVTQYPPGAGADAVIMYIVFFCYLLLCIIVCNY